MAPDRSEAPRRLTRRVLFVLCVVNLVDNINSTLLVPYVDAMVSHLLGVRRGDPSIAVWVSVLTGSYSVCEVLFSGFWGMLSDRVGRRPVLLVGMAGSVVAPVLFGMSQSLPAALASRLLDGFFCGNVGVTRTYLGELVDASNEAQAFGTLSLCFSIGIFIGPLLGGMLAEPVQWAPSIFSGTIFDRYPYLLPNLAYSCLTVVALVVGACSLQETHAPGRRGWRRGGGPGAAPLSAATPEARPRQGSGLSRGLVELLAAYSLLSGYTAGRLQAFVLTLSLPRSLEGFSIGPKSFGCLQVCASAGIFLTQTLAYARGIKRFGPHRCYRAGMWFTILLNLLFPVYGLFADPDRFGLWRYIPLGLYQGVSQVGFAFCYPTVFMLINREASPENRGSVNGWTNSGGALTRGLFPLLAGGLFGLGCRWEAAHLPLPGGRYLVFYVVSVAGAASSWLIARRARAAATAGGQPPGLALADAADAEAKEAPEGCAAAEGAALGTGREVGG